MKYFHFLGKHTKRNSNFSDEKWMVDNFCAPIAAEHVIAEISSQLKIKVLLSFSMYLNYVNISYLTFFSNMKNYYTKNIKF